MCIARVLLLGLLPFLSLRGPVCEHKRQSFTMEGNNSQGNEATQPTNYFEEIIPSVRAFLFMMAAFGLFTIMILLIIFLVVKILRVMYPIPTPRATDTPVNLQTWSYRDSLVRNPLLSLSKHEENEPDTAQCTT